MHSWLNFVFHLTNDKDSINHDREKLILNLHQVVEQLIQPYLCGESSVICRSSLNGKSMQPPSQSLAPSNVSKNTPSASFLSSATGSDICLRSKRTLQYFQELFRLGLWPITGSMRESAINSILAKFKQFPSLRGDFNIVPGDSSCDCTLINFKQALRDAAARVESTAKGLCLTCVQNGKLSARDGNCQAMSRSICSALGHPPSAQSTSTSSDIFLYESISRVAGALRAAGLTDPNPFSDESISRVLEVLRAAGLNGRYLQPIKRFCVR